MCLHLAPLSYFVRDITERKQQETNLQNALKEKTILLRNNSHAVKPGGHVIMATFSLNGPTRCSGLPVVQYSAETLQQELGPHFQLIEHANERHVTPSGAEQHFIYCHFIKSDSATKPIGSEDFAR